MFCTVLVPGNVKVMITKSLLPGCSAKKGVEQCVVSSGIDVYLVLWQHGGTFYWGQIGTGRVRLYMRIQTGSHQTRSLRNFEY